MGAPVSICVHKMSGASAHAHMPSLAMMPGGVACEAGSSMCDSACAFYRIAEQYCALILHPLKVVFLGVKSRAMSEIS